MLEWTAAGSGARFMGLVHHTDAVREWAYDRNSPVGRLDKAWDEAVRRGWTVVDMKRDWKKVFPVRSVNGARSRASRGVYASRSHFCMKLFLAAPARGRPLLPTALA
jgi:hypothetical protein